ncbi:hypothetical protein BOO69_10580 [Sulfitobacter alexandrii]|uniref:DUF7742 domain-containing protein n=1 Tax=Sulfitobacter alexandrii TaxID=1917485 RepID=A0A1J0WI02_9RHOB|nr:hypothetical protein BOO69_10580 [Sulfitobacter alexandrii]
MRAVLLSDVIAAARALRGVPASGRAVVCARMLREAHWADRHTRRLGKVHAAWGNGTLKAAAEAYGPVGAGRFDDPEFCECLQMVAAALAEKCRAHSCKRGLHAHMGF